MARFLKYEFNNKLLSGVILRRVIQNVTWTQLYIYIYIEREREREREIGSSYPWCNSTRVTHFLSHRFLKDLTVKKKTS